MFLFPAIISLLLFQFVGVASSSSCRRIRIAQYARWSSIKRSPTSSKSAKNQSSYSIPSTHFLHHQLFSIPKKPVKNRNVQPSTYRIYNSLDSNRLISTSSRVMLATLSSLCVLVSEKTRRASRRAANAGELSTPGSRDAHAHVLARVPTPDTTWRGLTESETKLLC